MSPPLIRDASTLTNVGANQRQPLPQQPHQGKSRVSAMLLASFFSLFVLFVLFERLRELRFSDPLSGSSPDSVTESNFDPLSRLDLLELECDLSLLCLCPSADLRALRFSSFFSSSPLKLPFRRIPFTVFDVETCLFCASTRAGLLPWKLPPFGSSNTTEARFMLPFASLEGGPPSPVLRPKEFNESVLCKLLFCRAYFLRLEAEGESLVDFFRVPVESLSSVLEKVGQTVVLSPSNPEEEAPLGKPTDPLPGVR